MMVDHNKWSLRHGQDFIQGRANFEGLNSLTFPFLSFLFSPFLPHRAEGVRGVLSPTRSPDPADPAAKRYLMNFSLNIASR